MTPHENQSLPSRDGVRRTPLSFLAQKSRLIMLKRSSFASFILALNLTGLPGFAAAAPTAGSAAGSREIISFDSSWRFHLGDEPAAKQSKFDDTNWRTLDLPHDWSIEGPLTPPDLAGKQVVIEFDGVYMNSEVWINGQFLGRRPYGFVGFRYDLTQFLKSSGTPNVVAVRVDDSAEPSLRWYAGSGIYRHVRLITMGYTTFRLNGGVFITTPEITPEHATVQANYIIDGNFFSAAERQAWARNTWNMRPSSREVVLRSSVLGPDDAEVARTESKLMLSNTLPGQVAM